ncbi:hypothetical protein L2X98_33000 [Microbacterium elymi]|uniref:Uncharacterized protein n=1 Tax=Microbacterium elymi TaxID=2909587 RepID=A0ABY5NIY8_9MICO|nr:hypothetical protein [Microbacterium elymi]UUT35094.1 hypothetical protein L2X98_33000 [Microbacterium elymi]
MIGEPLSYLTQVGAVLVLVLLAVLSVLILTRTPPNRIGRRLGDLYAWMFGAERADGADQAGEPTGKTAVLPETEAGDDPKLPWWRRNKTGREQDPDEGAGVDDLTELSRRARAMAGSSRRSPRSCPPPRPRCRTRSPRSSTRPCWPARSARSPAAPPDCTTTTTPGRSTTARSPA